VTGITLITVVICILWGASNRDTAKVAKENEELKVRIEKIEAVKKAEKQGSQ